MAMMNDDAVMLGNSYQNKLRVFKSSEEWMWASVGIMMTPFIYKELASSLFP